MQKLSDEELVRKYIISHIQCFIRNLPESHQWSKERDSLKSELLSRLERGRKAIEAMGKLFKEYESFLISDASGEYDSLKCKKAFFKKLEEIITSQT